MTKYEIKAPNQIPHPSGVVVMPHISNVAVCQIPASAAKGERQNARRGGGMCKFITDRHINRAFPVSSENDAAFSTLAAISPCSAPGGRSMLALDGLDEPQTKRGDGR